MVVTKPRDLKLNKGNTNTMIDIQQALGDHVSPSANHHVKERIIENLKLLLRPGMQADPSKMMPLHFAIGQLCKVKETEDIDWLALTQLAANITVLWNGGFLKEQ